MIFKNILALLIGLIVGGCVNMGLILIGMYLIPPPVGVDVSDAQSIGANIDLYEPKHFLIPFLAHALGTLVGATITCCIAVSHRRYLACVIGIVFLVGGIMAAFMIPAPVWFIGADLLLAYIPMALFGAFLGMKIRK